MTNEIPATIYYGPREAIITEIGEHAAIYEGKYLIYPYGDAQWDAVGCNSKKDLKVILNEMRDFWPSATITHI
jgi:hypothetical protein